MRTALLKNQLLTLKESRISLDQSMNLFLVWWFNTEYVHWKHKTQKEKKALKIKEKARERWNPQCVYMEFNTLSAYTSTSSQ